jgi:hypothetical protein
MAKQYKGTAYIGVVGSENENGVCRDSIEGIKKQKGDEGPFFLRATKGYEARQTHFNNWYYKSKHPFILLLDSDMLFPPHTLSRLRSHKIPYVSGFYMRRTIRPVAPVWFDKNELGVMPFMPLTASLEKDKLYPIGASGWGCMLIHRDVVTAVKKQLKGEPEIIEDDMDLYPYDVQRLLRARKVIADSLNGTPVGEDAARFALETIVQEIRPLRGVKDTVGSDIRFPFYALLAGFQLYGDTGVLCEHMTNYPVSINDWLNQPVWAQRDLELYLLNDSRKESERLQKAVTV